MKDCLGREIRVGDIVTYPVRQGSSLWVNIGTVIEIHHSIVHPATDAIVQERALHIWKHATPGFPPTKVTVRNPNRVTIAVRGDDARVAREG